MSRQVSCPVCGTSVRMNFPGDWPTAEDVQIRYARAVFAAAGESYEQGRAVAGLAYNTFRRLVLARPRHRRVLTRGESGWLLRPDVRTEQLEPIGPAGLCGGEWAEVGSGAGRAAFDLRFVPGVDAFSPFSDVPSGRPTIALFEADYDCPRVFSFGEPVERPSVVVHVGVGPSRAISVVLDRAALADAT